MEGKGLPKPHTSGYLAMSLLCYFAGDFFFLTPGKIWYIFYMLDLLENPGSDLQYVCAGLSSVYTFDRHIIYIFSKLLEHSKSDMRVY